jgi:hypothetical protein
VPIRPGRVKKKLIVANIIGCPTGLILVNNTENRKLRFDDHLKYLEDYFFYLSLIIKNNSFCKTSQKYFYRIHKNQSTSFEKINQLNSQLDVLKVKVKKLNLGYYYLALVWLRIQISRNRLSGSLNLQGFFSIITLGILCPNWLLGRIKMKCQRLKK